MQNDIPLYPLKFTPILKEKVWGGQKLSHVLNKKTDKGNVGESWELSGVDQNISVVANGALRGQNITTILERYRDALVGMAVYKKFGNIFPLLFKFIDAEKDLSVQLHPDDNLAQKRHGSFGKTEMWYIVQADEKARIIVGFDGAVSKQEYIEALEKGTVVRLLHNEYVTPGDTYFIKPGLVHAIGAGVLLAEIQQTSDITYRIYDWDRPDTDGNLRELHTDMALEAIDFNAGNGKIVSDACSEGIWCLKESKYFCANLLKLEKSLSRDFSSIHSFVVYMCVAGQVSIEVEDNSEMLNIGETVLIPACFDTIRLTTTKATLLETYIP